MRLLQKLPVISDINKVIEATLTDTAKVANPTGKDAQGQFFLKWNEITRDSI